MLSTPGRISGLLSLSASSRCCLVGTLLCVAAVLSDLWYKFLISKFSMNFFFPLLQMQRNKIAFCTTQMLFLASYWFLDLTQNFHLFWSCCWFSWVLGLTCSPTPKLWSKCLPEMWNISTSINSFFDIFSPRNQSLSSFLFRSQSKYLLR